MKKLIILFAVAGLFFSSCTKKIDEAYANPNADVKAPVETLLPNMIATMATNGAGHGPMNDIRFIGKYIQNFVFCNSGGRYDQMGGTTTTSDNAASIWRTHFYDLGQNVNKMIEWAAEEGKWDYVGVGKAILAWSWLTLSDYHGEVISTNPAEAFNTSKLTFTYGTQEEVYNHVKQLCYEAIDYLGRTGDGVSQANLAIGDQYMYNGDATKWRKFAHGIMARLYNHLSNKSTYNADSVIYYCDNSILVNGDNAMVKFANSGISGTANFYGPLRGNLNSTVIGNEYSFRQSSFIAKLLSGTNTAFPTASVDPRAWYLLRPNSNGTFVGLEPNVGQTVIPANDRPESFWGKSQAAGLDNTAPGNDDPCRYLFRNNSEWPVMTASEIQFIKAEAALRDNDKVAALAAYRKGIELNFDMLSATYSTNVPAANLLTTTLRDNYLNNPINVPVSSNDITLTKIMLQKYIALYIHGACETWTDMRRYQYNVVLDPATGLPTYRDFALPNVLFPDNGGQPVYRVRPRYNSEYVWNLNELRRIGADQLNYHTVKPWFMLP